MRILMLVNDFGPPWDEAGKNNALEVARQLAHRHEVSVLGLGEADDACLVEGFPVARIASPGYRGSWKRPLYLAGYARLLRYASRQASAWAKNAVAAPPCASPPSRTFARPEPRASSLQPPASSLEPRASSLRPPDALVCFWETASTGLIAALVRDTLAPSARLLQVVWTDTYRLQLAPPLVWLREHLPNLLFNNGLLAGLAGVAVDGRLTTSLHLASRLDRVAGVGAHGVDVARFRPPGANGDTYLSPDEGQGTGTCPPVVGYLGHATHAKGLDLLFEAMRPLLDAGRARMRVALSDSPEAAALRAAGFPGTEFSGYADPATFFGACDVVAVPRRSSYGTASYPNTVLEAMACGRTVVTTRQPGIEELVDDGRTGFLVEPGDPLALRACLSRLLEDAGLRERVGHAARHLVEQHFSWEAATDPIEWWLEGSAGRGSRPDGGAAAFPPASSLQPPASERVKPALGATPPAGTEYNSCDQAPPALPQPFACTVVVARDHSALLEAVRRRGRKDLNVVHLDSHCDLRGWVLDRARSRGRWLRALPPRLDGGNVLGHLAAEGWARRILWWHPPGAGREDDLGTYLEADELPGSGWRAVDGGGDDRWVPLEFTETDGPPDPGSMPPVVDVLSLDWDFFAPYPTPLARAGASVNAFLAWLESARPVPDLIFLCSSPDYASAHQPLFEMLAGRLGKLGRTRPWFQDEPWSGPWGASPFGRVMTGSRAFARRCLIGLKRMMAGSAPRESDGR